MSNHFFGIEEIGVAQAVASRAGAHRVVERKEARLQFGQAVRTDGAGKTRGKPMLFAAVHLHRQRALVAVAQRSFKTFRQPLLDVRLHFHAVDDHVDIVLDVFFQLRHFVKLINFAVHAHPRKALRLQVGKEIDKLALTLAHRRRQNHHARVFRQLQHGIDHLRHGLAGQRQIVFGAIRRADAGVQKAQVIMDFRNRTDG